VCRLEGRLHRGEEGGEAALPWRRIVSDFIEGKMTIQSIHTKADHAVALARIEALWHARPGTPAHDELEVLGTLVAAYEDAHWPILPPDPVDAIKFHMEQNGLR
jgi:hypothetical protein